MKMKKLLTISLTFALLFTLNNSTVLAAELTGDNYVTENDITSDTPTEDFIDEDQKEYSEVPQSTEDDKAENLTEDSDETNSDEANTDETPAEADSNPEEKCSGISVTKMMLMGHYNENHEYVEEYFPVTDSAFYMKDEISTSEMLEGSEPEADKEILSEADLPSACPEDLELVIYLKDNQTMESMDYSYTASNGNVISKTDSMKGAN